MTKDIKIKNFHCSEHGFVKPNVHPKCPACEAMTPDIPSEWEKRFDEEFPPAYFVGSDITANREVKQFIRDLLCTQQEKYVQMVDSLKEECELCDTDGIDENCETTIRNNTLQEISKKLRKAEL